ncbi:hypothetical protein GCM10025770_24910 [Viridibacterium curvum]|uniref:Pectate lyase domain-containing protein n=1 Tax=Viridibacterium curvum TaxID=1101404 RepID=A0ABP9QT58_9RHOO
MTVTTGTELNAALCNRATKTTPIIIMVNGTINHGNTTKQSGQCDTLDDAIQLKGVQNVSIIGVGSNALLDQIGIHIRDAKNIIIRNLHVRNVKKSGSPTSNGGDAIGMESSVSNVWVDHCTLEASGGEAQGYDGLFDIKDGTTYITLSWSILKNSERGGLVGSSDSDNTNGPVTYHHNYYSNLNSRIPLLRHATAHSFNNYFDGIVESGMNPRIGGKIKAENNYFTNAKNPIGTFYTDDMGYWDVSGNIFGANVTWVPNVANKEHPAGPDPVSTTSITIPYVYTLDAAADIPAIVVAGAGAGKMPNGSSSSSSSSTSTVSSSSSSVSSVSSSSSSSSVSSSSVSSSSAAAPVCSAAFSCDTGVGAGNMNAAVTATGSDSFSSGVYTVNGAGVMGSGTSYNHYFKYMPLTGDFTITARITAQGGNHANARAGLLAAETLTGTHKFAWAARYSSTGEIRAAINGNNGSAISGVGNTTLPAWVRIKRVGSNVTVEASTDGTTFFNRGSATMTTTESTLYVGFAVSSNSNTATVTATFDNLTIVGGGLP